MKTQEEIKEIVKMYLTEFKKVSNKLDAIRDGESVSEGDSLDLLFTLYCMYVGLLSELFMELCPDENAKECMLEYVDAFCSIKNFGDTPDGSVTKFVEINEETTKDNFEFEEMENFPKTIDEFATSVATGSFGD